MLLAAACTGEDDLAYATVTVYNQADFNVTELHVYIPDEYVELKQNEQQSFNIEWAPNAPWPFFITYRINDNYFDVDQMEGALYSQRGEHYYSPFNIKDGAKAYVYINNEGYRVEIAGGVYIVTNEDPTKDPWSDHPLR
jgi:hypothetical protein